MDWKNRSEIIKILFGDDSIEHTRAEIEEKIRNLSMNELRVLEDAIDEYLESKKLYESVDVIENHIDRIVNKIVELSQHPDVTGYDAINKACYFVMERYCDEREIDYVNRMFEAQHGEDVYSYFGDTDNMVDETSHRDIDSDTVVSSYKSKDFKKDIKSPRIKKKGTGSSYRQTKYSAIGAPRE